jgi:hypothetical protein
MLLPVAAGFQPVFAVILLRCGPLQKGYKGVAIVLLIK